MKKLLSFFVSITALCSGVLSAQEPVQYSVDLAPFTTVELAGPFEVSMVRGQQYRALISVMEPYMEYVDCYVSAGVLTLKLDERLVPLEVKRQFRTKGAADPVFSAVIYIPDAIHTVTMSGKTILHDTEDLFDDTSVSFSLQEQAQVRALSLCTDVFKLDMKGKSVADFTVASKESLVEVSQSVQLAIVQNTEKSFFKAQGSSKMRITNAGEEFTLLAKSNCSVTMNGRGDKALFDLGGTCEVDATKYALSEADVRMSSVCKLYVAAADRLSVNLNGGSTLYFAGNPFVEVDNIRSATMSRLDQSGTSGI